MLIDTPGQPLRIRRRGGLGLRPVDEGSGERQVQATVYGDAVSDPPDHSLGRPVRSYDTAGERRLAYDFRGRVAEEVRRVIEDIDALDRVVEQAAPNGSVTATSYDPGGKLLGIELDAAAVVEEILCNARGHRLSIAYGNGTETTYEYDQDRFWLTRLLTMRSTEALQDLSYTHDAVGNVLGIEDAAQEDLYFDNTQVTADQTFTYDSLYRLVQATGREKVGMAQTTFAPPAAGGLPDDGNPALRTYTQSTTYDAAGNITQMHHVPSSGSNWTRKTTIHEDNNQLLATSIPGNPSAYDDEYAYGERGAMVFMPHLRAGVSENVVRDFRDQVRKVLLLNSGDEAWYATDAAGQRVRKVVRQGQYAHERIYVGGYEIYRKLNTVSEELDEEIQTVHVMDGEQQVLMAETRTVIDDEPVTSPVAVLRYQYSNHLGTAALECDEDGEIISYEEYHPYGSTAWWAEKSGIQVSRKRYRYTGMERDEETGMAYHHHRYYMPWLGRWASADPAGLVDGVNRFQYGQSSPGDKADPLGLAPTREQLEVTNEVVTHLRDTQELLTETEFTIDVQVDDATVRTRPDVAAVRTNARGQRTLVLVETKLDPSSVFQPNQPAGLNAAASGETITISANSTKAGNMGLQRGAFEGGVEVYVVDRSNLDAFLGGELAPLDPGEIFTRAQAMAAEAKRQRRIGSPDAVPAPGQGAARTYATEGTTLGLPRRVARDASGNVISTVLRRTGRYAGPAAFTVVAVWTLQGAADAAERGQYGRAAYDVAGLAPGVGEVQTGIDVLYLANQGVQWWIEEFSREAGRIEHAIKQASPGY